MGIPGYANCINANELSNMASIARQKKMVVDISGLQAEIDHLTAENATLKKAILDFGNGTVDFDWMVLARINTLEDALRGATLDMETYKVGDWRFTNIERVNVGIAKIKQALG